MTTEVEQSYNTTASSAAYMQSNVLELRLETQKIVEDIELYLRGAKIVIERDDRGRYSSKSVSLGTRKANDLGIQGILTTVTAMMNAQVVQGNFMVASGKSEPYEAYIEEVNINLATNIVNNCCNWEVQDDDIDVIIDFIMSMLIPFMSRLINNEERRSYVGTIQHQQRSITAEEQPKKKGLGFFGG